MRRADHRAADPAGRGRQGAPARPPARPRLPCARAESPRAARRLAGRAREVPAAGAGRRCERPPRGAAGAAPLTRRRRRRAAADRRHLRHGLRQGVPAAAEAVRPKSLRLRRTLALSTHCALAGDAGPPLQSASGAGRSPRANAGPSGYCSSCRAGRSAPQPRARASPMLAGRRLIPLRSCPAGHRDQLRRLASRRPSEG